MDKYISSEVDTHFKAHKTNSTPSAVRTKSIVDLALKAYRKQKGNGDNSAKVDVRFKNTIMNQMKIFLFLGHDTTSSTVCYVL